MMQDRPDLIASELAGCSYDGEQNCFRAQDIERLFEYETYALQLDEDLFISIDPAAGGPQSDYAIVTFARYRGMVRVVGGEILSGISDPQRHFDLVKSHISRLRTSNHQWIGSRVFIYCERNLGCEAEHHRYALQDIDNVFFRMDESNNRCGLLTTNDVKHACQVLLDIMLRENRVSILPPDKFISLDSKLFLKRLRDQLGQYSFTFKQPDTTFQQLKVALSGKLAGGKDDICVALQLGIYFTDRDAKYGTAFFNRETHGVFGR